jgi:hypothetical protein
MPATSAMRHELRERIRASNANTTAVPNSARMMYHGVYEIIPRTLSGLYYHQ